MQEVPFTTTYSNTTIITFFLAVQKALVGFSEPDTPSGA